jgi:4-hydroxybenzoate polyprenyltransferase
VLIGPLYGLIDRDVSLREAMAPMIVPALATAVGFALIASACYAINDVVDAPKDRLHPRKRSRPVASGAVSPATARLFAAVLAVAGLAVLLLVGDARWAVVALGLAYAANVMAYSFALKRIVIADVMCLSLGFVVRVLAGCAAAGVAPSTWLLNSTLFLAMFLAFGKRLGERRTVGQDASASVRSVHGAYTDELLRMMTLVTGVVTLLTYAGYVQSRDATFGVPLPTHPAQPTIPVVPTPAAPSAAASAIPEINALWFTLIPVTYALLRAIVLLERGRYDDPTEMASKDLPMQAAVLAFIACTVAAFALQ